MRIIYIAYNQESIDAFTETTKWFDDIQLTKSYIFEDKLLDDLASFDTDCVVIDYLVNDYDIKTLWCCVREVNYQVLLLCDKDIRGSLNHSLVNMKYLVKPYTPSNLHDIIMSFTKKTRICLSGGFKFYYQDELYYFPTLKLRDLFIYLIAKRKKEISGEIIMKEFYSDVEFDFERRLNLRQDCYFLNEFLESNSLNGLFSYANEKCYINIFEIDCDYYQYLDGNNDEFDIEFLEKFNWEFIK